MSEPPYVTIGNIFRKLSTVGLRLEHIVATLIKKNTKFIIESVNTDTTQLFPPKFMATGEFRIASKNVSSNALVEEKSIATFKQTGMDWNHFEKYEKIRK